VSHWSDGYKRPQHAQAGFSLVELLIATAIALFVLTAVFSLSQSSAMSHRTGAALAQMGEDASVAMSQLRLFVGLAGYSAPQAAVPAGGLQRVWQQRAVFGCDGVFANPAAAMNALSCGKGGADAIAIAFQADSANSLIGSDGKPMDCAGNQIEPSQTPAGLSYALSYNRFYVVGNTLFCKGSGGTSQALALVENVQTLEIEYGVSALANGQVSAYLPATRVDNWANVVAVRLCLVMRSAQDGVLPAPLPYAGCKPFDAPVEPTDRRLYRAYTLTVLLPNQQGAKA